MARATLLLVDDDPVVHDFFRLALDAPLRLRGEEMRHASDYREALDAARAVQGPLVIYADYHLGGGHTGLDVLHEVADARPDATRVLFSGTTTGRAQRLARAAGVRFQSKFSGLARLVPPMLTDLAAAGDAP